MCTNDTNCIIRTHISLFIPCAKCTLRKQDGRDVLKRGLRAIPISETEMF